MVLVQIEKINQKPSLCYIIATFEFRNYYIALEYDFVSVASVAVLLIVSNIVLVTIVCTGSIESICIIPIKIAVLSS